MLWCRLREAVAARQLRRGTSGRAKPIGAGRWRFGEMIEHVSRKLRCLLATRRFVDAARGLTGWRCGHHVAPSRRTTRDRSCSTGKHEPKGRAPGGNSRWDVRKAETARSGESCSLAPGNKAPSMRMGAMSHHRASWRARKATNMVTERIWSHVVLSGE